MLRTRERPPTKADQERMVHNALAHGIWRGAEEIFVSPHAGVPPHPAMTWLAGLGWTGPPPANLRWHDRLHHPQGDSPPGVVAALRDRLGFLQGVLRVWFTPISCASAPVAFSSMRFPDRQTAGVGQPFDGPGSEEKHRPPLALGRVNGMRAALRHGPAPPSGEWAPPLVLVRIEAAIAAAAAQPGRLVWAAVTERNRDLLLDELAAGCASPPVGQPDNAGGWPGGEANERGDHGK